MFMLLVNVKNVEKNCFRRAFVEEYFLQPIVMVEDEKKVEGNIMRCENQQGACAQMCSI